MEVAKKNCFICGESDQWSIDCSWKEEGCAWCGGKNHIEKTCYDKQSGVTMSMESSDRGIGGRTCRGRGDGGRGRGGQGRFREGEEEGQGHVEVLMGETKFGAGDGDGDERE